jgi:hypothetical protein
MPAFEPGHYIYKEINIGGKDYFGKMPRDFEAASTRG